MKLVNSAGDWRWEEVGVLQPFTVEKGIYSMSGYLCIVLVRS